MKSTSAGKFSGKSDGSKSSKLLGAHYECLYSRKNYKQGAIILESQDLDVIREALKKIGKIYKKILNEGVGVRDSYFLCFLVINFLYYIQKCFDIII